MERTLAICLVIVMLAGCGSSGDGGPLAQDDKLICFVSVPPLAHFVERIGGEFVVAHVMMSPGQSPATFEPTPKQIARLTNADVYFAIGVPFENRILPQIERSIPTLEVVRSQIFATLQSADFPSPEYHAHFPDGHDPHIWLGRSGAGWAVEGILRTLIRLDPANDKAYLQNADALIEDLDALHRDVLASLARHNGKVMYVFHPAFGFLVEPAGIRQIAIEEGGAVPGSRHVATVIDSARSGHARAVFVQPEFSSTTARNVADAVGAEIVRLDPLAEDYFTNIRYMTAQIDAALEGARRQFPPRGDLTEYEHDE